MKKLNFENFTFVDLLPHEGKFLQEQWVIMTSFVAAVETGNITAIRDCYLYLNQHCKDNRETLVNLLSQIGPPKMKSKINEIFKKKELN